MTKSTAYLYVEPPKPTSRSASVRDREDQNTVYMLDPAQLKKFTLLPKAPGGVGSNGDTVAINDSSEYYKVSANGNLLRLTGSDGERITIYMSKTGGSSYVTFVDGQFEIVYTPRSEGVRASMTFGGVKITSRKLDLSKPPTNLVMNADVGYSDIEKSATAAEGKTLALTIGIDGGSDFVGTSGDDTYNAPLDASLLPTLGSLDSLDGGAGTDTLNLVLNGSPIVPAALTSIEKIFVTSATNGSALDLSNAPGVTDLSSIGSAGTLTVSKIASTAVNLMLVDTNKNHTFNYAASAATGAADSAKVTLKNVSGGTLDVGSDIETISLTSTGSANAVTLAAGPRNVTVAGSQNLTLTLNASQTSVDASTLTGALVTALAAAGTLTGGSGADSLTGSLGNDSLTGGAGNDTLVALAGADSINGGLDNDRVVFEASGLTAADIAIGGDGTDTLVIATGGISAADAAGVSGFEQLEVSAALTIALSSFAAGNALTTVVVGVDDTVNFGSAAATTNSLVLGVANASNQAISFDRLADTTNTLTITRAADLGGATALSTLTVDDEESLTINTTTTTARSFTVAALEAEDLTSLTITGNGNVSLTTGTGLEGTSRTVTVSAAASTGTLVFDAGGNTDTGVVLNIAGSSTAANTITGGGGADSISGGAVADSLLGGAGKDTLSGGEGNDTITGGDGADTIYFGTGTDRYVHDNVNDSQLLAVTSGSTALTAADVIYGAGNGDLLEFTGNGAIAASGTALATTLRTLPANTSTDDGVSIVRGNFDTSTQVFTANAAGNDYLVQVEEAGTDTAASLLHSVVLADITGTLTYSMASGVITLTVV